MANDAQLKLMETVNDDVVKIDKERLEQARGIRKQVISEAEQEQYVSIPIQQYTDWMLKAHTLCEVKKLYDNMDDEEAFFAAIGALLK